MYIHIYKCMYTHIHVYTYVHIRTYVYIYTYIQSCVQRGTGWQSLMETKCVCVKEAP